MTTEAVEEVESIGDAGSGPPERYRRRCAEEVAAAIRGDAERIKRREVEEAIGRLEARGDLGDLQRDVVEGMADAIVEEFLAVSAENLQQPADWSAIYTALRLFDPEFGATDERAHADKPVTSEVSDDD